MITLLSAGRTGTTRPALRRAGRHAAPLVRRGRSHYEGCHAAPTRRTFTFRIPHLQAARRVFGSGW